MANGVEYTIYGVNQNNTYGVLQIDCHIVKVAHHAPEIFQYSSIIKIAPKYPS